MSSRRMAALVIVALLHAALGYAFITGLAFNVVKKAVQDLKTFDVEDTPPPPETPPPPPPKQVEVQPPPVVSPPPIVQAPQVSAPIIQTVPQAPPVIITPTAPTAPPPPPKPSIATTAKPKGSPQSWVTNDDYPSSEMRAEHQGVTGFRLDIGPDGKVTNCSITSSSGFSELDNTACRLLMRRARFSPAKDADGNGVPASFSSRFRWEIPKD